MRYVRVWDVDQRWLWPNLSYLLRLHGTERVERYGGVDPGKGVDKDLAAVLIREFGASGRNESEGTKGAPLVAAEWYPAGAAVTDKQTVVHAAQSDEFTLHLGGTPERSQGLAAVSTGKMSHMGHFSRMDEIFDPCRMHAPDMQDYRRRKRRHCPHLS
jgi:hypothetical protein